MWYSNNKSIGDILECGLHHDILVYDEKEPDDGLPTKRLLLLMSQMHALKHGEHLSSYLVPYWAGIEENDKIIKLTLEDYSKVLFWFNKHGGHMPKGKKGIVIGLIDNYSDVKPEHVMLGVF